MTCFFQEAIHDKWQKAQENVSHLERHLSDAQAEMEERKQQAVDLERSVSDMAARADEVRVKAKQPIEETSLLSSEF